MKTINKLFFAAAAVLALAFTVLPAKSAGLSDGPFTLYSVAFHSPGGATNITTGYTNTLVPQRVQGSLAALSVKLGGSTVNVSNNVTLVVFPAMDSVSHATGASYRIALLPTTTYVEVITNISVYTPWVHVQLENPGSNLATLTNTVIRATSKVQ